MEKLLLASGSPRRRELLEQAGVPFDAQNMDVDESLPDGISAESAAAFLACRKAKAAARLYPERWIVAADTVVVLNGVLFGKPKGIEDACDMIRILSGKRHVVETGVAVLRGRRAAVFTDKTAVEFFPLSDGEILRYVETGEPLDKAGAYGIQGAGGLFVSRIEGNYDNVVGLPVGRLIRRLEELRLEWRER